MTNRKSFLTEFAVALAFTCNFDFHLARGAQPTEEFRLAAKTWWEEFSLLQHSLDPAQHPILEEIHRHLYERGGGTLFTGKETYCRVVEAAKGGRDDDLRDLSA